MSFKAGPPAQMKRPVTFTPQKDLRGGYPRPVLGAVGPFLWGNIAKVDKPSGN